MDNHPCSTCLQWWECNGIEWNTDRCPHNNLGGINNENREAKPQDTVTRKSSQAH
jgi:hypothetical protein